MIVFMLTTHTDNVMATRTHVLHLVFKKLHLLLRTLRYNIRREASSRWGHAWNQRGDIEHPGHEVQRCNATCLGLLLAALTEREQKTLFSREGRWAMYPSTIEQLSAVIDSIDSLMDRPEHRQSTPCNPVLETTKKIRKILNVGWSPVTAR